MGSKIHFFFALRRVLQCAFKWLPLKSAFHLVTFTEYNYKFTGETFNKKPFFKMYVKHSCIKIATGYMTIWPVFPFTKDWFLDSEQNSVARFLSKALYVIPSTVLYWKQFIIPLFLGVNKGRHLFSLTSVIWHLTFYREDSNLIK